MHFREHHFPLSHPTHRRHGGVAGSSRVGSCLAGNRLQEPQVNRMADLPALIMQHVVALLDHGSRLELRKADKRCRQMVDSCWRLLCLPLAQLRRHDMESLAQRFAATSCFVISEPEQRVSISRLGYRRRCEHLLTVFLDNTAPWPHLIALDLSAAITSLSPASLELLAISLPGVQHLALPKVAASSEFAHAPAHEVLHVLSQLQELRSLELDCSLLPGSSNKSAAASCVTSPRGRQDLPLYGGQGFGTVATAAPAVAVAPHASILQHTGQHALQVQHHSVPFQGTGGSTSAAAAVTLPAAAAAPPTALYVDAGSGVQPAVTSRSSNSLQGQFNRDSSNSVVPQQQQEYYAAHLCNPWLQLQHLRHLQQLQLVNPCGSVQQELLPALAGLQGLRSLGLVKVQQALFEQLLDPGQGARCGRGLGQLQHSTGLTRLELGLQQPCSCKGSEALLPAPLIIPPHSTSDASSPTAAAAAAFASAWSTTSSAAGQLPPPHNEMVCRFHAHTCCWSHLTQLQVLVLGGVSLDCPLLAATAACSRLSELHVGGLQLEHELPPEFGGLTELKLLAVSQRFDLGPNCAAVLFPALLELSIRDDGSHCPDLSCLKHHRRLRSVAIEAAGPGWQLSSLQLGHLVHIDSLRQLSLASRGSAGYLQAHAQSHAQPHMHAHGQGQGQAVGSVMSPGRSHPRMMSPGGSSGGSSSSHWLPIASLSQVTLLTLSGPCNDHTLSQLPSQFPGLVSLQLLGSYYASDWGLKRLSKAPQLSALLLDGCEHVTEYGLEVLIRGGGIKVLVVNECSNVDERACQRIRRACRNSCTCLHWHGTDDSRSSHGSHSSLSTSGSGYMSPYFDSQASHSQHQQHHHHHHPCLDSAAAGTGGSAGPGSCNTSCHSSRGSAFLERCWREAEGAAGRAMSSGSCSTSSTLHGEDGSSSTSSSSSSSTVSAVGEPIGVQQGSNSSRSMTASCSQTALAAAGTAAAAHCASSSKASPVLQGLARLSLTADASCSDGGPSTPRKTEGHRNIDSSSSCAGFELQQQPELGIVSGSQPVAASAGCAAASGCSRLQPGSASAKPRRSAFAVMAAGGQQPGAADRSSAIAVHCSDVSGAPVVASAGISVRRNHSIGSSALDAPAAAGSCAVSVQRSSSSGPGGAGGSRVGRFSCVAAVSGNSSVAAALGRWPRHSHPGPAYAH